MAEAAAGVAISAIALAGLFNNAIDWFEYIHVARQFGTDYSTAIVQLDTARLRLSRWGEAMGLNKDLEGVQRLPDAFGTADDIKKAEKRLGKILELYEEAKERSGDYVKKNSSVNSEDTIDTSRDLERGAASLHQQMRHLSLKRQNSASLTQKFKWAVFDAKDLKALINRITVLTNDLIELYPNAKPAQEALAQAEISEIRSSGAGTDGQLQSLRAVADEQDPLLAKAISKVTSSGTMNYGVVSGNNNSGSQVAINTGSVINHYGK